MKRLTKELKKKILIFSSEGKSVSQIANILNIPEVLVVRVVSPHY